MTEQKKGEALRISFLAEDEILKFLSEGIDPSKPIYTKELLKKMRSDRYRELLDDVIWGHIRIMMLANEEQNNKMHETQH